MPTQFVDRALTPHFFLSEFTHSQEAVRRGLANVPSPEQVANLMRLAQLLEKVRFALGNMSILISSGYRSAEVNAAVGGATSPPSAHLDGRAADFTAPSFGTPQAICRRLVDRGIEFDQVIDEAGWVHLGIAPVNVEPRRQVLTATFVPGEKTRYAKGLVRP